MVGALDMPDDHPALADGTSRPNYGDHVIRRSFRFGLALGLLGGLAAALAKMLGSRTDPLASTAPSAPSAPWPRLVVEDGDQPAPVTPRTPLPPAEPAAPVVPAIVDEDPVADVDLVPDPPAPAPAPAAEMAPASAHAAAPAPDKPRKAPLKAAPAPAVAPPVKKAAAKKVAKAPAKAAAPKPARAAKKPAPPMAWVEPIGDVCPTTHPVKGKLASLIFHVPGGLNYARTRPDRCYLDAAAAEADGLRPSKR